MSPKRKAKEPLPSFFSEPLKVDRTMLMRWFNELRSAIQPVHVGHMCSFCGASKQEVAYMIAGPAVNICEGCVEQCNGVLRYHREKAASGARPLKK